MTTSSSTAVPYDVLVVGGGPAGLSAAIALSRSRRSVLVVDAGQPRNAPAGHAHNYLGREGVPPLELLADGRATLAAYGGQVVDGTVATVTAESGPIRFHATLADGSTVQARRLLVASGLVDELPEIPGLADRWGRDVLHCPYCHGYEVRDHAIGVLVTGPMAMHQALMFRQLSADVTVLLHRGPDLAPEQREQLVARDVRLVEGEVTEVLVTDDALSGVRLASGKMVPLQALVIAPRATARSELLSALGVPVTEMRVGEHLVGTHAEAEPTGATAVPGVFVAGNVGALTAQVVSSAAAGLMAGGAINFDLINEETAQAVAARRATPHAHEHPADAEAYWDERYRHSVHRHDQPNPVLVEVASGLEPGEALDLGCGYGADVVWLAQQGWTATGTDVSATALRQAEEAAAAAGLNGQVRWERHDLGASFPDGTFDLVTTHYLHSPALLVNEEVLRRAAAAVAPGGTLLVVGHATTPPWADHGHGELPGPDEVWASLDLAPEQWQLVRRERAERAVTGPDGEQATMTDAVVVARRR